MPSKRMDADQCLEHAWWGRESINTQPLQQLMPPVLNKLQDRIDSSFSEYEVISSGSVETKKSLEQASSGYFD